MSASPPTRSRTAQTALGTTWLKAPLIGIAEALHGHLASGVVAAVRAFVGVSGALILLASIATAVSGIGRLAYSLGEHGMLPRAFGRLGRRTHIAPQSIVAAVGISIALLVVVEAAAGNPVIFLASLYSFGVLLAFAAAQVAVLRLRVKAPDLPRPYRVPLDVKVRGRSLPLPTLVGLAGTLAVFVIAMVTHPGARYAGPVWLACGLVVFYLVRRARGESVLKAVRLAGRAGAVGAGHRPDPRADEDRADRRGDAGDRDQARAGARFVVEALHVIRVPLDAPLDFAARAGGGARGGVARGGAGPGCGERRRGRRRDRARTVDRRGDRPRGAQSATPT